MARFRVRGPAPRNGPAYLLVGTDAGPQLVAGRRSGDKGVMVEGVLYPDELLRDLGYDVYQLAGTVTMPADGDLSHGGAYEALTPASQLEWTASWASYDAARRRLNLAALWDRGAGIGPLLRNLALAAVLVMSLYTGWATWGLKSGVEALNASAVQLNGLVVKLLAPTAVPAAVPVVAPTVPPAPPPRVQVTATARPGGGPAGDRGAP